MTDGSILISAKHLQREYRDAGTRHMALDDVNLEVRVGERIALMGRSGSGKSTLLNLLGGVDQSDGGEIYFQGQALHALSERDLTHFRRAHLGFVYQFFNLIPTLTVAENVQLPLELNQVNSAEIVPRVRSELERIGLREHAEAFPDQLSGGEQQRVAIARALIHRPKLVLAGEPTGNLDAENGQRILELLTDLTESEDRTLIIATHSLVVAKSADRSLTLQDGRVTSEQTGIAW